MPSLHFTTDGSFVTIQFSLELLHPLATARGSASECRRLAAIPMNLMNREKF
jgi:hypothetical protein